MDQVGVRAKGWFGLFGFGIRLNNKGPFGKY